LADNYQVNSKIILQNMRFNWSTLRRTRSKYLTQKIVMNPKRMSQKNYKQTKPAV